MNRREGFEDPLHGAELLYERANEKTAKALVYFGPYLIWGTLGLIGGGILLLP